MIGLIPAAGYGTRLKELGNAYPKCILPYKEKPLLFWNIMWLMKNGCDDIRIIANHHKEKIKEVVDNYDLSVKIISPLDMSGLSMSILSGIQDESLEDSVLILLGDILVDDNTQIDFSENWVSTFTVEDWQRWCMIDPVDGKFYDKSKSKPPTDQALSGVYFFKNSKILVECIKKQINEGEKINGEFQFSGAISKSDSPVKLKHLKILDFGTINDYLKNRNVGISRNFNTIVSDKNFITKKSQNREKLLDEYNWYKNIPKEFESNIPRLYDSNFIGEDAYYEMERLYFPTLREIYLFFDRSQETWEKIISSCIGLQKKMQNYTYNYSSFSDIYDKTIKRVKSFSLENEELVDNFLLDFYSCGKEIDQKTKIQHGDFCFSNLFWDELKSSVLMVDPKGNIFGSEFYDWAKFRHSAIYNYDFIDAELYTIKNGNVKIFDDCSHSVGEMWLSAEKKLFSQDQIYYLELLTASLFLSMIPLHNHNQLNQKLYFSKFSSIYTKLTKK